MEELTRRQLIENAALAGLGAGGTGQSIQSALQTTTPESAEPGISALRLVNPVHVTGGDFYLNFDIGVVANTVMGDGWRGPEPYFKILVRGASVHEQYTDTLPVNREIRQEIPIKKLHL